MSPAALINLVRAADTSHLQLSLEAALLEYLMPKSKWPVPWFDFYRFHPLDDIGAATDLIYKTLPGWYVNLCWMPSEILGESAVRCTVGGPGYLSDDHTHDTFEETLDGDQGQLPKAIVLCVLRAVEYLRREFMGFEPSALTEKHGLCENKRKPGGCPLHNLQCGWPTCDQEA